MLCTSLLNIAYFVMGLKDSRISAIAQRRHRKDGFVVDMARMMCLVLLQMLNYVAVGLSAYSVSQRLALSATSIFSLWLGTKLSVIGLTGGIATGKSTVVEQIKGLGPHFKIIDSDQIVAGLYEDPKFIDKVFKVFGKEAIASTDGKTVDRAKLGKIVFADKQKRAQLSKLTSWPIFFEIIKQIFKLRVL